MIIDTKFDRGDTVFYMNANKIHSAEVVCITFQKMNPKVKAGNYTRYILSNGTTLQESQCFTSKQEILNSL